MDWVGCDDVIQVMNSFLRQLKAVVDDDYSMKMLQLFNQQVR